MRARTEIVLTQDELAIARTLLNFVCDRHRLRLAVGVRDVERLLFGIDRPLAISVRERVQRLASAEHLSRRNDLALFVSLQNGLHLENGPDRRGERGDPASRFEIGKIFHGKDLIEPFAHLFQILAGEMEPDEGTYKWGVTTSQAYFPKDFGGEFDSDYTITEWLTQYSEEKDVTYVRGFLGRMLFSGEDGVKKVKVLSGGEKVRCLLSKMMISGANVLLLDEPTNHLDMEAITALNNGLIKFPGVLLFTSRDHQIVQTTANRIMEIVPGGQLIDKITTYDEYLASDEMARKRQTYSVQTEEED